MIGQSTTMQINDFEDLRFAIMLAARIERFRIAEQAWQIKADARLALMDVELKR